MSPFLLKSVTIALCSAGYLLGSAAYADQTVSQKGRKFTPKAITISTGEKLKIVNDDKVPHNVFYTDANGKKIDKGLQKPGQDAFLTFDTPGTYKVRCSIHLMMKMNVTVE